MDRSQLTPEEYGAVALSPAAAAELSKDEIIARWSERFERLKASSARQVSELSEEVARLQAQVASLRALLDENGISEDGGLSLEEALAVMTTGVKPAAPARSGAGGIVPPSAPLALAPAALTSLSGLHSSQNVIAVVVAGRLVELEDAPALVISGGADR